MGIPVPQGLTQDQVIACERFSLAVWGRTLFEYEASHNGRHGYACDQCLQTLRARDAEIERGQNIRQPWELAA